MAFSAHGTLTAGEVTAVVVETGWGGVEVVNRSLRGTIWVRFDGEDPVPYAPDTFCVIGARSFNRRGVVRARLVAAEALEFSVEAS